MSDQDLRVKKTKKTVKAALKGLLFEKALEDISITELSKKAEINRKTFYKHYKNPEAVLDDIVKEILVDIDHEIGKYNYTDDLVDIKGFIESLNGVLYKDKEFYKMMIKLKRYNYLFDEGKNLLKKHLINDFPRVIIKDERYISSYCEFLATGIFSVYFDWFMDDEDAKLNELTPVIEEIVTRQLEIIRLKYDIR